MVQVVQRRSGVAPDPACESAGPCSNFVPGPRAIRLPSRRSGDAAWTTATAALGSTLADQLVTARTRGQWLALSPQRIEPGAQAVGNAFPGELVDVQPSLCAHPSKLVKIAHHAIDSQATAVNVALTRDAGAL